MTPNAGHQARLEAGAQRTLEAVVCRVEPAVPRPAPHRPGRAPFRHPVRRTRRVAARQQRCPDRGSALVRSPESSGDRVRGLEVPPLVSPMGRHVQPRLPSSGCLELRFPNLPRDDDWRRLPPLPLGVLQWSRVRRDLVGGPLRRSQPGPRTTSPGGAQGFSIPVPFSGHDDQESRGSPTFPSAPSERVPRSETPGVSSTLALVCPGLRPSGACTPSACPAIPLRAILADRDYTHVGAPARGLLPRDTRLHTPITGTHAGSLLTGWLGVRQVGLEPLRLSPTGSQQRVSRTLANPLASGFPWREHARVRRRFWHRYRPIHCC
jgi:hypothetical protein